MGKEGGGKSDLGLILQEHGILRERYYLTLLHSIEIDPHHGNASSQTPGTRQYGLEPRPSLPQ
jgi:hypothetical protein